MNAVCPALHCWSWIVVGSACTVGCSVDDRRLQPIVPIPDAVASNCGIIPDCDSTDDDASSTGDPGQSCTGLCPDLNHDNLLDSTESLTANGQFDEDIERWSPDTGIGLGWNGSDACGKCDSGAMAVTNEYAGTSGDISVGGARQCLPAEPERNYEVMVCVKPEPESLGRVVLEFHSSADCTGAALDTFHSPFVSTALKWQRASTPGVASSSAHSVSVQLAVAASVPPKVGFASVFFDNVLLTAR